MSNHNICSCGEVRKILIVLISNNVLSGATCTCTCMFHLCDTRLLYTIPGIHVHVAVFSLSLPTQFNNKINVKFL